MSVKYSFKQITVIVGARGGGGDVRERGRTKTFCNPNPVFKRKKSGDRFKIKVMAKRVGCC